VAGAQMGFRFKMLLGVNRTLNVEVSFYVSGSMFINKYNNIAGQAVL
jgi:hypothetical protein